MKEFSNGTKSKRTKAILKVILKRYSFIVWLPVLLIICNFIGVTFLSLIEASATYAGETFLGFIIAVWILLFIILTGSMIENFIQYLKEGTILEDFIFIIKIIIEVLVVIFRFFISLPKRIFLRIKDEKRRFNNSLDKELGRDEND